MTRSETDARVQQRLEEVHRRHAAAGPPAKYYASDRGYYGPEEAGEERDHFAICVVTADGAVYETGDTTLAFPLQSLSKVFAFGLALQDRGREGVLPHVGVEPSGDAFNSIVFDERHNRPYNPMVNAGALVTSDLVRGDGTDQKLDRLVELMRRYAANPQLQWNRATFAHEIDGADHNRATAYLMRANGMLAGDVEEVLALYLRQCAVTVTCRDLAAMAATLANGCVNPLSGERTLERRPVRDVLSVMHTCGMYDYAGQWAFEVGVPAKSGVSGGILAVIPGKMGIGVFSPGLDVYGNSVRGVRVCEDMSDRLGLHVFASEDENAIFGPPH